MLEIKEWTIRDNTIPAIDGLELYSALNPGRDFSTWVKHRIQSFRYVEGFDYTTYFAEGRMSISAKEYLFSLPMASELCLLDRSDTGTRLRQDLWQKCSVQKSRHSDNNFSEDLNYGDRPDSINMPPQIENTWIECLIDRVGDTTMTIPGSYGRIVTFRRNSHGRAVAQIDDPTHRKNILKSMFYRPYVPPSSN